MKRLIDFLLGRIPPRCFICRKRVATQSHPDGGSGGICADCAKES